ncbi:MAG: NADH-quinone oxidoreductase subunit J [Dehalococcoidia bacterium]
MTAILVFFFIIGALALVGSLGVVFARNVVHSALFLILALLAVAGLFVLLLAEFLAIVQVLIYGGAITILLLFALMMTRARELPLKLDNAQKPLALVAAGATFAVLTLVLLVSDWPGPPDTAERPGFEGIANTLFRQWAVPFEVASLILLVALIGAIVISRPGGDE